MKKLTILSFALLFSAGTAIAQNNDATIQQSGSDNEAHVGQVFQSGVSNGNNEAFANQTGDGNTILGINQRGAGNYYSVIQIGSNNIVDKNPDQGSPAGGSFDGYISINQLGDYNKVWDADQAGSENSLIIHQSGGDMANIEAQVSPEGGAGNSITIDQYYGENSVGEYSPKGSGVYQEGEANTMSITQSGGAKAGTESVMVSGINEHFFRGAIEGGQGLIQFGDDNIISIDQDGASTVKFVVQDGNVNHANLLQSGDYNTASVSQVGDNNSATIQQY